MILLRRVHCVMVIIICSSLHLAPPLTLSNVLAHVQGVKNWRELGEWLLLCSPVSEELNVIQRENTTDQDRLRAAVELWLKGERGGWPPSWRSLVYSLDWAGELTVADPIRGFAEPPQGESSNVESLHATIPA